MESVALVTGGARGVGAAAVRALAARGHAVAIHCHASLREARELAAELAGAELAADYEVNVIGPFVVAQEAAAVMAGQPEGGRILALAAAGRPDPDAIAFAASQGALPALMASLDAACRARHPRLRAGCLIAADPLPEPAVLATLMLERLDELGRVGDP